jgi:hypothetical protein
LCSLSFLFLKKRNKRKCKADRKTPPTENKKKILPINSINTVIHYTSTKASSRRSEIGPYIDFGLLFFWRNKRKERKILPVKSVIAFLFFFLKKKKHKKGGEKTA